MRWMMDAATITYREKGKKTDDIGKRFRFLENSWHELPESELEEKYMHPDCSRRAISINDSGQDKDGLDGLTSQLAVYVPYIKYTPQPQPGSQSNEVLDVLDKYMGSQSKDLKLPFHRSRTLDTYYRGESGKSEEAIERDSDQVLSRYAKRKRHANLTQGQEQETEEILHVGQLWLWVVDENTIITGTSHHPQAGTDPIFEAILNRLSDSDESFKREAVLASTNTFVKFILSFYINIIDNLTVRINSSDTPWESINISVETIFRTSIEEISRIEYALRGGFRERTRSRFSELATKESSEIYSGIARATDALIEIKDIRGELKMIRSVIQTQERVWRQLLNQSNEDSDKKQRVKFWKSTDPSYVLNRVQRLIEFAEETEKNVESVLGLHMNQLSLHEAENARTQGETLMVFTVVTVIFAPLSFATSLFALNISVFPHSGENVRYQPGWIFGILVGILVRFSLIVWIAVKVGKPHVLQRLGSPAQFFAEKRLSYDPWSWYGMFVHWLQNQLPATQVLPRWKSSRDKERVVTGRGAEREL
ncbi:hypothetical protein F4680DRAFT_452691 [Xylaria scruposa]|nr:hypothetical protein F4680DRAFT_452691 [Xylaria scruposa]